MSVDQKIVEDIKKYGWHIINVFEGEGIHKFSYSIGLTKSFASPELFVSGIDGEVAASILNNIANEIKIQKKIEPLVEYDEFFDGYKCYFDFVEKSHYDKYFGKAVWFYQGDNFPVLQCVWPNKVNLYPWQTEVPFNQDVLIKT